MKDRCHMFWHQAGVLILIGIVRSWMWGIPLEGAMAMVWEVSMLELLLNPAPVAVSSRWRPAQCHSELHTEPHTLPHTVCRHCEM